MFRAHHVAAKAASRFLGARSLGVRAASGHGVRATARARRLALQPRGGGRQLSEQGDFRGPSIGLHLALFLLFAFLPKLLRHLPARFINVPRRDHWFSPERMEESVERLTPYLDWLGLATLTFTAAVSELTLRANLSGGGLDNTAAVMLVGGYALVMIVWSIRIRRAFV